MKHLRNLILALALSAGLAPAFAQAPPPVPALPDSERRTSYVISGSTCACSVGMQLYQDGVDFANWLTVYVNGVQQVGNWTITSPSGSIATLPRPISNAVLTFTAAQTGTVQIVGAQRPRRLSEFAENRGVAARDLNQVMNSIEAQLRELWDRQFRTVQAPPGETLNLLPVLANRANMGACFDANGMLTSCIAAPSGSFAAGNGINFTGTNPTTISTASYTAGTGIQFTGSNPTVISASSSSSTPLIPTRAAATALDLSAYTVVETGGYATGGDGGGGTFQKIGGGTPFIDSFISTGSITNNGTSGCTNGTYPGQTPNSPNTQGFQTAFSITVAGNVVTSMTVTAPGNAYAAGTVLSFTLAGCSTTVTWTIASVTTPSGSFTDAVGTRFQIVYPADGIDVRAMGVKMDWTVSGGDGAATDNFTPLQNAMNFAAYAPNLIDTGASNGGRVNLPRGTAMFCGAGGATPLKVWNGVALWGQGTTASVIKACDSWSNSTNLIELCDSQSHVSCFGASLNNLQIFSVYTLGVGNNLSTLAAVYTNSCQQQGCGLYGVVIYPGSCRQGIKAETGYGGASLVHLIDDVEIKGGQKAANCAAAGPVAVSINYGTTQVTIDRLTLSGLSAPFGPRDNGVAITGGFVSIANLYPENVVAPLIVNIPTDITKGMVTLRGTTGGASCVGLVTLASTNTPGNFLIGGPTALNGCTRLVTNGQPTGLNLIGPIISDTIFNP